MELVGEGVRQNFVPDHDSLKQCRELGQSVGQAVNKALGF
jgi:hypothetical protein